MITHDDVLALFTDARLRSGYAQVRCPFHNQGNERRPSMSILLEDKDGRVAGFVKCFTCGWIGDFNKLQEQMGLPPEQRNIIEMKPTPGIKLKTTSTTKEHKSKVPFKFSPYLYERGISMDTQRKFKVYDLPDRVVMPIFDASGYLQSAPARSHIGKAYYMGPNPERHLWGMEEITDSGNLFVTEGQIDAMTLWENGLPAVATISATISHGLTRLKGGKWTFTLAYDNDEAGHIATEKALKILGKDRCHILKLQPGHDINSVWMDIRDKGQFINYLHRMTVYAGT